MTKDGVALTLDDVLSATSRELATQHRLLPPRYDYAVLLGRPRDVATWLRPRLRRLEVGARGDVVFAGKGWRGTRPLTTMSLQDAALYRALCNRLVEALPANLVHRLPMAEFRNSPLSVPDVTHISKTDVTAYYEYVDHETLSDELIGQTGDEPVVDRLIALLGQVMGRRVGLPQVHQSSDVLGDAYIDPVRRRLRRRGYAVVTYSDDFRIATRSLGEARRALEACASEVRSLGLVLNERKTYTYEAEHYRNSLTSFTEAEKRLFDGTAGDGIDLTLLTDRYSDDATVEESTTLGLVPIEGSVDEDEVVSDVPQAASDEISPERLSAAQRAFSLWASEDESEEVQSRQEAAITQSLLSRALPILGEGGDQQMLDWIEAILRFEPGVTPQVSLYLESLAGWGTNERRAVRSTLDGVVRSELLSDWQGIWIAYASGFLRGSNARRPHVEWLHERAQHGPDALAAHAAAALGRIGRGDPNVLAGTVDRLGSVWRTLALWGLAQVDRSRALEAADNQLDRILIESIGQ